MPYFTGLGTAAVATLTSQGRALIDDVLPSDQRSTLGLGTLAVQNTVTSLADLGDVCAANQTTLRNAGDTANVCADPLLAAELDSFAEWVSQVAITGTCNSGTFVRGDGTCAVGGTGNVSGTAVDTQVALWSGTSTQDGDSGLTYNRSADTLTAGSFVSNNIGSPGAANTTAYNGANVVSEGVSSDAIEGTFVYPDWAGVDKTITWQDRTGIVLLDTSPVTGDIAITSSGTAWNLISDSVGTSEIAANAVTLSEMADNSVDGTNIAMGSDAQGDILYYNES